MGTQYVARLTLISLAGLACLPTPGQAAKVNVRLEAAVRACDKDSRALLERVVAIDSGTGDTEGLNAVGALYAAELGALGASPRR